VNKLHLLVGDDIVPLGFYSTKDFESREALKKEDMVYYYHKQTNKTYSWNKVIISDVIIENEFKLIKFNISNETPNHTNFLKSQEKKEKEVEILISVHSNIIKM